MRTGRIAVEINEDKPWTETRSRIEPGESFYRASPYRAARIWSQARDQHDYRSARTIASSTMPSTTPETGTWLSIPVVSRQGRKIVARHVTGFFVFGITTSATLSPPPRSDDISEMPGMRGIDRRTLVFWGSSSRTSSSPIPSSSSSSGERVLTSTWRPARDCIRPSICGTYRTTAGCSDSSGSSSNSGPPRSRIAHRRPKRRNVPSEKSASDCQAP